MGSHRRRSVLGAVRSGGRRPCRGRECASRRACSCGGCGSSGATPSRDQRRTRYRWLLAVDSRRRSGPADRVHEHLRRRATDRRRVRRRADGRLRSHPRRGRFVATFDRAVTLGLTTTGDPPALGRLLITQPGLLGEPTALAGPAIPDLAPPPTLESDLSPHPDYGLPTSRTTFLVLPTATATIAQVNDAIAAIGGSIVAGMPVLDTITVAIADAGDFSAWKPALDSLRAAPGIADAAPVWQGDTEVTPAPTNLGIPEDQLWSNPVLNTARGQWGLRAIRAPQAWNTLPTAREYAVDQRTMIDTVVLDAGFGAHPDLPFASIVSSSGADDHGMVDAGIIGASFANAGGPGRTEGVVGVDPLSKLHGVEFNGGPDVATTLAPGEVRAYTVSDYSASFNWVLGEKRTGGRYPRLGVISASFGVAVFTSKVTSTWVSTVAGRTCNPGPADDPSNGIGGTVACSPATQDVFIRDMQSVSTIYAQHVLGAAATLDVVVVKSAGNSDHRFCVNGLQILSCPNNGPQTQLQLPAAATNEFIQARTAMAGSVPLLVVGAVGVGGQGASVGAPITFSQGGAGVDLVAPGEDILSTTVNASDPSRVRSASGAYYERMSGTSQAAPHVAGVVAYLRSAFNLSGAQAFDAIKQSTATVPFGRQLDMWAAVASLPRGRTALADQNDASIDGNERVQRTIDDASAAALDWVPTDSMNDRLGRRTADPDLTVDMRDVRAFRDAWLQTCIDGSAALNGGLIATPTCPDPNDIVLDGSAQSWKRDGNLDGCVNPGVDGSGVSPCGDARPTGGFVYPGEARDNLWDLNGDGYLTPGASATVPFDSNNQSTQLGTSMTDLDVLATVLSPAAAFEGWTRTQLRSGTLRDLMTSADVQVRFDRFGDKGTPFTGTVDVYVDYGAGRLVRQNVYVSPSSRLPSRYRPPSTGATEPASPQSSPRRSRQRVPVLHCRMRPYRSTTRYGTSTAPRATTR